MAEEAHSRVIDQVVQEALDQANVSETDLSAVAVTIGPSLSLCLRVGVQKARKTAGRFNLPIIGVHHVEAHTPVARLIERKLQFPFMALLISDGFYKCCIKSRRLICKCCISINSGEEIKCCRLHKIDVVRGPSTQVSIASGRNDMFHSQQFF